MPFLSVTSLYNSLKALIIDAIGTTLLKTVLQVTTLLLKEVLSVSETILLLYYLSMDM